MRRFSQNICFYISRMLAMTGNTMGTLKKNLSKKKQKKEGTFWSRFGLFLRQKRLESGLAEKKICDYIGTSVETLRAYEAGEKPIPLNRIYALANCLNIPPEVVLNHLST